MTKEEKIPHPVGRTPYHHLIRKVIMIIHYTYRAIPLKKRYVITTPSTVEVFHFHKKETDLGIREPAGAPSPNHLFIAGCRLFDDPAQQVDPATPIGSSPVSIEKTLLVWRRTTVDPRFSTCVPTRWARLAFCVVGKPLKKTVKTVWSRHLFCFILKGKNKIRKKNPKCDS